MESNKDNAEQCKIATSGNVGTPSTQFGVSEAGPGILKNRGGGGVRALEKAGP